MKSRKLNKMATTLAVLFLVLSGLMVVQWNAQPVEATEHEENIYEYKLQGILDVEEPIESKLEIKLRNLRTGDIRIEETLEDNEDFYRFTDLSPGWYEIIFPSQVEDGFAYLRETETLRIPEEDTDLGENNVVQKDIEIEAKELTSTIKGTLEDEDEEKLEDVKVTVENSTEGFFYSINETEIQEIEDENYSVYEIEVYDDFSGRLKVEKENFAPNITYVDQQEEVEWHNVTLYDRPLLQGYLYDTEDTYIEEDLDITLYNEYTGLLQRKDVGPRFRIRAPPTNDIGGYTLVVAATGYEPLVIEDIQLDEGQFKQLDKEEDDTVVGELEDDGTEFFETNIEFHGADNITITSNRTLNAATRIRALDYSDIGYLPMQIDMALGDGDGTVGDELEEFKERLEYGEADIPTTMGFLEINETVYELDDYEIDFDDFDDFDKLEEGYADEPFEGNIWVNATRNYKLRDDVIDELSDGAYKLDLTVENEHIYGNTREFTYTIELMDGYERFDGGEQDIPEGVDVDGYTTIEIVPRGDEKTSSLVLDIRESEEGEVEIIVDPDDEVGANIHEKEEDEEIYWVIKKGTNVTFEADYTPVTSRAINYNWTWSDVYKEGEELTEFYYTFDDPIESLKVEVTESSDNVIDDSINIIVDGEGPWGENITVNDENITVGTSTSVDEGEEVEFNGKYFEDNATGVVDEYKWTFNYTDGDEDQDEGVNVTYIFEVPGEYKITLNVTDIVGNWREFSINVTAWDVTEPEGDFSIEWNDNATYDQSVRLKEGTNVTFNGTGIVAHPEYDGELEFNWTLIGEDENVTGEGKNWTYDEFDEAGDYTIQLNVTDEPSDFSEGNYRVIEKTIIIERGPTPDLRVDDLEFSEENVRVGDTVTISVNVTNPVGENVAPAESLVVRLNGEELDEDDLEFYQDGEEIDFTEIGIGETVTIRFEWEAEEEGEHTITVNVTDAEEPEDLWWDNEIEGTINVDAPAWREYIVYALIPIIIIGVTVGLYFYKDKITELLQR